MKTLIVEDDLTSRTLLQELMKRFGTTHTAVNGKEAIEAVRLAVEQNQPYDLICLDIMMPEMDGQEALRQIREHEQSTGVTASGGAKIVMTTALSDVDNVKKAATNKCDYFLVKPIQKDKLMEIAALTELDIMMKTSMSHAYPDCRG